MRLFLLLLFSERLGQPKELDLGEDARRRTPHTPTSANACSPGGGDIEILTVKNVGKGGQAQRVDAAKTWISRGQVGENFQDRSKCITM